MSRAQSIQRWLWFLVLAAVSVGLLVFVLRDVDLEQVKAVLWRADSGMLITTLLVSLTAFSVLPTLRWQLVLRSMGYRFGFGTLLFARFGSQPLKFAIPMRGGEAFRALYLRRRHGVPTSHGLGSVLFDLCLVVAGQLTLLCLGLAFSDASFDYGWIALVSLVVVILCATSAGVQRGALRVVGALSSRLHDKLEELAVAFLDLSVGQKWSLYLYSLVVECAELFIMALCFHTIGISISFGTICTLMPVVVFISLIPVTISGFGTRELAILTLFAGMASAVDLTGAAVLFAGVEVIVPALLGCTMLVPFLGRLSATPVAECAATATDPSEPTTAVWPHLRERKAWWLVPIVVVVVVVALILVATDGEMPPLLYILQ